MGTTASAVSVSRGWVRKSRMTAPISVMELTGELRDLVTHRPLQQPDIGRQPAGELSGAPVGEESRRLVQQLARTAPGAVPRRPARR